MSESQTGLESVGFLGPIGWQEMLCCAFPVVVVAIVLIVLVLTGVIGGKKNP